MNVYGVQKQLQVRSLWKHLSKFEEQTVMEGYECENSKTADLLKSSTDMQNHEIVQNNSVDNEYNVDDEDHK